MRLKHLLTALSQAQRLLLKRIEKTNYKLNNAVTAVDFNKTCIINGLLPKYTYCRQAGSKRVTTDERKQYLQGELVQKEKLVKDIESELDSLHRQWKEENVPENTRIDIDNTLGSIIARHLSDTKNRVGRKLAALYGGPLEVPRHIDQFLNLSKVTLTEPQKKFLNLGLNCHFMTKPKRHAKRIEMEMLLADILRLEREKKVTTSPDLQAEFTREANISRGHYRSSILTPELKKAAEELKENVNIVIRKADKSSTFVILDKDDYSNKIASILGDTSKFKKITKNPTVDLKARLNRTIRQVNKITGAPKLPLIEGDHKLGYAYANIKTHKHGFPLRPIISQIPSVTYNLAKRLNGLITPFTPASHSLKSSQEFLDILKGSRPSGIIASMDVESLGKCSGG